MKYLTKNVFLALFLLASLPLFAVHRTEKADMRTVEKTSSNKISFGPRIVLKLVQKKIKKHQKKRKSKATSGRSPDELATLSFLLSCSSFLLILIPVIGLSAFFIAIAGIVLGVIALKRGGNKAKAILGIILGVLLLVFFTITIIALAPLL